MSRDPRLHVRRHLHCRIRMAIRRDLPAVLDIESRSAVIPWGEQTFLRHLRERNVAGMVAVPAPDPDGLAPAVGFMVYRLHGDRIEVLNLAVNPGHRRRGVGRQMVAKLAGKLSGRGRTFLELVCREGSLGAHLFLRATGWLAFETRRGHFGDTGEDGYVFNYYFDPDGACEGVGAGSEARA